MLQLSLAVPIFSYLIGIAAALFASWYTYGIAGMFWLHDTYHLQGGMAAFRHRKVGTAAAVLTVCIGAFICVAGTYVFVKVRPHPIQPEIFANISSHGCSSLLMPIATA